MSKQLHPALVGGLHPSEIPSIVAASEKAKRNFERDGEHWAVWIRPNSETTFTTASDEVRLEGCVQVFDTETGWITIPETE